MPIHKQEADGQQDLPLQMALYLDEAAVFRNFIDDLVFMPRVMPEDTENPEDAR